MLPFILEKYKTTKTSLSKNLADLWCMATSTNQPQRFLPISEGIDGILSTQKQTKTSGPTGGVFSGGSVVPFGSAKATTGNSTNQPQSFLPLSKGMDGILSTHMRTTSGLTVGVFSGGSMVPFGSARSMYKWIKDLGVRLGWEVWRYSYHLSVSAARVEWIRTPVNIYSFLSPIGEISSHILWVVIFNGELLQALNILSMPCKTLRHS